MVLYTLVLGFCIGFWVTLYLVKRWGPPGGVK